MPEKQNEVDSIFFLVAARRYRLPAHAPMSRYLPLYSVLAVAFSLGLHAQQNVIVSDTFGDGERFTQNLPSSLGWYTGATARSNLAVRNGALTLVANGSQ